MARFKNETAFENHLRILIEQNICATDPQIVKDNDGIVFINTAKLCGSYLQGNDVGKKYNGIKQDIFKKEHGLSDDEFVQAVRGWLSC